MFIIVIIFSLGTLNYRHVYIQLLKTICFNKPSLKSYLNLENGRANEGDRTTHNWHRTSASLFGAIPPATTVPPAVPFVSVLTHPLCGITEKLPPKTSIRIVLRKAPDAALLIGGITSDDPETTPAVTPDTTKYTYSLEIKKMVLFNRQYQMLDKILNADKEKMERKPAKFFYYRPQSSWVNIPQGTNFNTYTIFKPSDMVSKIWLVFYDQGRLSGDLTKSLAFFEKPPELESIVITIGVSRKKIIIMIIGFKVFFNNTIFIEQTH